MKIYEFSPFHNENEVLEIKASEGQKWVDKIFVIESNKTFQGHHKLSNFKPNEAYKNIVHNVFKDFKKNFKKDNLIDKLKNNLKSFINHRSSVEFSDNYVLGATWKNEATQRNYSQNIINGLNINDEDILIFSDIDEIIDSKKAKIIIEEVKKRGIITVKLKFSMYYLNLFVKNWGGPEDYSYRVFVMTGSVYKKMNITIDMLRKAGERKKLMGIIYCPEEIMGFHHSWLGDENFIKNKLSSWAHVEYRKVNSIDNIRRCLQENKSIIGDLEVEKDDSIQLLDSVQRNIKKYEKYLF